MRAGMAISGANGTAPPAAVGARVPSSFVSSAETPRAELHVILYPKRCPLIAPHPRRPGGGIDGVRGGAEREDVEDHGLVVADPIGGDEPALRMPPHADHRGPRPGPGPVHSIVDRVGERADERF